MISDGNFFTFALNSWPNMKIAMEENTVLTTLSVENYNQICNAVLDYMNSFESEDESCRINFNLKRDHIHRVIGYTEVLSRSLELDDETIITAQLASLLHDVGRFEQFEKYQTFNDFISVDHAELGVQIIYRKDWLADLPEELQNTICKAVSLHNKIAIPKGTEEHVELIAKIVRDADKVDILDLAVKEYSLQNGKKNPSITLDLENSSAISKPIYKSFLAGKLPDRKEMKTVTDFKLVQMAFVYDLNFRESFSIINKKGLLKKLFDSLPKTDEVFELYRKAKIFVENKLI